MPIVKRCGFENVVIDLPRGWKGMSFSFGGLNSWKYPVLVNTWYEKEYERHLEALPEWQWFPQGVLWLPRGEPFTPPWKPWGIQEADRPPYYAIVAEGDTEALDSCLCKFRTRSAVLASHLVHEHEEVRHYDLKRTGPERMSWIPWGMKKHLCRCKTCWDAFLYVWEAVHYHGMDHLKVRGVPRPVAGLMSRLSA